MFSWRKEKVWFSFEKSAISGSVNYVVGTHQGASNEYQQCIFYEIEKIITEPFNINDLRFIFEIYWQYSAINIITILFPSVILMASMA